MKEFLFVLVIVLVSLSCIGCTTASDYVVCEADKCVAYPLVEYYIDDNYVLHPEYKEMLRREHHDAFGGK